jgi:hypothetical protein
MSVKWTEPEIELLRSLAGDMPWPMVVKAYRQHASTRKLTPRSPTALLRYAEDYGIHRRCVGEWLTTVHVAKSMNTSVFSVYRWIRDKRLESKTINRQHWISRAALRKLAKNEPELFGGLSEAELMQLLDQEGIARSVAEQKLPARSVTRPVACLETGQRFASIGAAARAAGVSKETIRKAVIEGWRAKGRRYRLLRPDVVSTSGGR